MQTKKLTPKSKRPTPRFAVGDILYAVDFNSLTIIKEKVISVDWMEFQKTWHATTKKHYYPDENTNFGLGYNNKRDALSVLNKFLTEKLSAVHEQMEELSFSEKGEF